jgi:hydroxymethylglutaryl-CoA lyase
MQELKIIETVRDGFQGLQTIIPSSKKIEYINSLLKADFEAIDIGSFVSEKAIPQMADTEKVLKGLSLSETKSKLMVLVANEKGAIKAASFNAIDQIIFPFSISESFLKKNINADFKKAESILDEVIKVCFKKDKEPVIYLAMAFGNPYQDLWNLDVIHSWVEKLIKKGIEIIPLSDITGESNPEKIKEVFSSIIPAYPKVEFGFHLHTKPNDWYEKIDAAYETGCRRFDSVLGGLGGCPMTGYELLSNLDTRNLISYFDEKGIVSGLKVPQIEKSRKMLDSLL